MSVKKLETEIQVLKVTTEVVRCTVIGRTPLIMNSMSAKAMRDLLLPKGRKTTAEKASSLKHDPVAEFVNSMYIDRANTEAALYMPAPAFKGAAETAALDMPGTKKSEVGRLLWINGMKVPVWGRPYLYMAIVRSADMNKTPDVRTRAMLPEWCAEFECEYNTIKMRMPAVMNLFAAAGITAGIGDFRQEKGAGNYGQFTIVEPHDPRVKAIKKAQGAKSQLALIENPQAVDDQSQELLDWYLSEKAARGF